MDKKIKQVRTAAPPHLVGDGFKVRNFIGQDVWHDLSPFLMLDYNEPWIVGPANFPRGVDVHPHKGFETVTISWSGSIAHEDSSGGKGEIGPGDVQWMTAGSGILHKEFHSESFSKTGGTFHMAQLWVNLPASYKKTLPSYQELRDADMGRVQLSGGGELRVIAGEQMGAKGPARTFTRINLYDVKLHSGGEVHLRLPEGDSTAIAVMQGNIMVNDEQQVWSGQMVLMGRTGTDIRVASNNEALLLVLSGEPISEPVAAYGPFVMNTKQELLDAIEDFNAGKFGVLQ